MRRLFIISFLFLLSITGAIVCVRWLGSFAENPAERYFQFTFENELQACWHNICPGITPVSDAEVILRRDDIISDMYENFTDDTDLRWYFVTDAAWLGSLIRNWEARNVDDTVYGIQFYHRDPLYPLQLGNLILLYGTPLCRYGDNFLFRGNIIVSTARDAGRFNPRASVIQIYEDRDQHLTKEVVQLAKRGFSLECPIK